MTWVSGNLEGGGFRERVGNGGGQFTSNLRPRWTDPVTARRVPSKWKRVRKGSKRGARGNQQKEKESKGNAPCMSVIVYIEECLLD